MPMKTYGKQSIAELLNDDWSLLGHRHELRDDGIWAIRPTANARALATPEELRFLLVHPTRNFDEPALPFPFTAAQFIAFCRSHEVFEWEGIESAYSNDDRSLDEQAIAELALRSQPAAELVRLLLSGSDLLDAQTSSGPENAEVASLEQDSSPRTVDHEPAGQTHSTRGRAHLLDSVIKLAQVTCVDTNGEAGRWDATAVWVHIEAFAARKTPPAPLIGVNSGGVQYRDGGQTETFTKKALADRFRRAKAR